MAMRSSTKDRQMRQRIAQEAARIMAEQAVPDFYAAKRKAAERLGAADTRNLPRNTEVEDALIEYQRLFQGESQARHLRDLRRAALEAMRFLSRFRPRLVGSVLRGTAHAHSDVNLHVFADAPEDVAFFLMDEGVPYETADRRLRQSADASEVAPVYRFIAGGVTIDLTVFPPSRLRQAPLSPINGKPMERAHARAVEALLGE
ncbi:MAG: hypothetical protein GWN84_02095 [Gammaproteobacteria bacterium]|nr:hypothetical protein [Gammaproteobacteria bacterium]NIR59130.1 hypothetical protein [Gammaproteobacteria bacterium]